MDGVEYIVDGIAVDVYMVDLLLEEFIEDLFGDFTVGTE